MAGLPEPEEECPECKGKLDWKVVRGKWGKSFYNGLCKRCNIVLSGRETPGLKKGRVLAEQIGSISCMDTRNTQHNADVQLGYLRAIQHCRTCGGPTYPKTEENKCKCTNCNCIYCTNVKPG